MDQPIEAAERALLRFFPPSSDGTISTSQKVFSESDFRSMSEILRRAGRDKWSKVPRIYTVLRLTDQLQFLDSIVADNISDFGLPFTIETLPEVIKSQSARFKFLEMQRRVLTEGLDLEKESGQHRHFSRREDIPFVKVAEIAKGAFGYVDRVVSTLSYREYARKQIPRGRTFKKNKVVLGDFERELATLKKLSHSHIVRLVGSYTDPKYVGILMLPVADCNLKEFLHQSVFSQESRSILRTFFGCLASALCYLHENRIRPKDVKPENVLVKDHIVYLTDFGISLDWSKLEHDSTSSFTLKTFRYCAPEVAEV